MRTADRETIDDLTFHAMLGVLQTGMWLQNDIESFLRQRGMSHGRFSILLAAMDAKDGSISPGELARRFGKSKPTIAKMITRLQEDGHIEVSADPEDARRKRVALTEAAEAFLDRVVPAYNGRIRRMSAALTDGDKRRLMAILSKLDFNDPFRKIETGR